MRLCASFLGISLLLAANGCLACRSSAQARPAGRSIGPAVDSVVRIDFGQFPVGPLTGVDLLGSVPGASNAIIPRRTRIARVGAGGNALMAYFPAGAVGPKAGGATFILGVPPSQARDVSYRIFISSGFDFANGGKLPGLCSGGGKYSGGRIPVHGDGWSARLVWGRSGSLGAYLYHVGMKGPWGETIGSRAVLRRERWHRIRQAVELSPTDHERSRLRVWVDDTLVMDLRDLDLRRGDAGEIDSICFSAFHGGNGARFAPARSGFILFDDLESRRLGERSTSPEQIEQPVGGPESRW